MAKRKAIPELQGRQRRALIAQVRREQPNCWICGRPIDLTLDAQTDPMGSTVDEVIPRTRAVDPLRAARSMDNLRHAHRRCNAEKGNSLVGPERSSRDW